MQRSITDGVVGLFMMLGLLALLFLAFKVSGLTSWSASKGYDISALFQNIGDLKVRAPVSLAGVKIGEVTKIALNKNFDAVVSMHLQSKFNNIVAENASASIFTAGILGSNYIAITPGYSMTADGKGPVLKEGSRIKDTQPAVILEKLISQFMFNMNKGKSK